MANASFNFVFSAGSLSVNDVQSFRIERTLGKPVQAEIEILLDAAIDVDELLGQPAYFAYGKDEPEHEVHGIVMGLSSSATLKDADAARGTPYRFQISSLMGVIAEAHDFRIFQDMDVKEIVTKILADHAIIAKYQSWRTTGKLAKREYCVQYDETVLAFVSRLLEEEGIYYRSEKGDGAELIVFEDDSTVADPIEGNATLLYRHGAGLASGEDALSMITERHKTATGKITLRDYEFKTPDVDLTVNASADTDADLEVYDYPGLYFLKDVGTKLAKVKLEALQAERHVLEAASGCARLTPGKTFTLTDAPDPLDGDYFVTSVVHELSGQTKLAVKTTMIPKKVPFRTPQRTPKPVIDGPQTAMIVAPPSSPAEEIHTDEHARVKVKFHWDRYGKKDDSATAWMRTSQLQTSGSMILPRLGWEVVVEYLEGNPDRPIVTGRLYNGKDMPPYALPEGKTRTSLGSAQSPGGGVKNEIRMEDKAGSEEVMIHSTKDTTIATANNKTVKTAVNETKNVKVNSTLTVGSDQTVKVTNGYEHTVGGAQTVSVGGSRKVEVNAVYGLTSKGASASSIGGTQMEMDGNPIAALLQLAVKAATEAAQAEAQKAMAKLDQAVSSKVDQAMGPINALQSQVQGVAAGMDAVSGGNLGAAAGAMGAASSLPSPGAFASSLAGNASASTGLDALVHGAIGAAGNKLGAAAGAAAGGGGGASGANAAGPEGAVGSNSAADSATGPGYLVNHCSATHTEHVGSIKASIAAAGIHTTVTGARTQKVGAARVELVGGTRAETCSASKTEKAVGLVVLTKGSEDEQVTGSRTTMVGGAILEKIGAGHSITATGMATFVGAFHKIDASGSIVFKCGDSEVVIDGGGVTIKGAIVTFTSPKIALTGTTSEG